MKEKGKPVTRPFTQDDKTKPKFQGKKVRFDEDKATLITKTQSQNSIANQLLIKSAAISEESSKHSDQISDNVEEIDPLFIKGVISNIRPIDEQTRNTYKLTQVAEMFQVQDHTVILVGRHRIGLKDGFPVGLYAPSYFKSARDQKTGFIKVLVQRKNVQTLTDPMQYPYIVVDPDNSIYPTYICSWIECKRKISIQHYIQYNEPANEFMILGNAIHRYMEWIIRKQVQPVMPTQVQMKRLYNSLIYQMFLIDLDFDIFAQKVQNGIVNIVEWYDRHVIKGERIQLNKWQKQYLVITKAIGSEIMFRSNYFGIRGKVDGLFEGEYIDEKNKTRFTVCIPFELKTGKKVLDTHKRQIDMYTLLVREFKNMPVLGLLFYSETSAIEYRNQNCLVCFQNINVHRNKIIINLLNLYENPNIVAWPSLPQIFDQCKFCNVSLECGLPRVQALKQKFTDLEDIAEDCPEKYQPEINERMKQLTILQVQYVKKWVRLLHLQQCSEKQANVKSKTKNGVNKLKMDLKELQKFVERKQGESIKIVLKKRITCNKMSENMDSYFKVGEKLRIFIPLIRIVDGCRINSVDKNTKVFFIQVEIRNQQIKFNRSKTNLLLEDQSITAIDVELEKYDNSFYNFARGYVHKFVKEAPNWMRHIVIEETYKPSIATKILDLEQQTKQLNQDQTQAFQKCVNMNKFALVQGMPGTGKTKLILKLAEYFYGQGKTVLITAFTNQALLNILEREINDEKVIKPEHIVREGSRYGITQGYQELSSHGQKFETIIDYKSYFQKKKVWIVTISSLYIQHIPSKFDVVILDQASQCLQPNCLQALLKAEKFILIGDQKQLQPVVKSEQASKLGMQVSLFERLCKLYPQNLAQLKKQYRMHPLIMNLSNKLVYDQKLELAESSMNERSLIIDSDWKDKTPSYLRKIVDPKKPLWFVNHDLALSLLGDKKDNVSQVKRFLQINVTCKIYSIFRELGVERKKILIISAYNSLVHQIVNKLKNQKLIDRNQGDVLTIDRSQGTDKQVILFLFHKGNKDLVENPRRLNVALTRAKNKFIIIGSRKQLDGLQVWTGQLVKLLQKWQYDLGKEFIENIL